VPPERDEWNLCNVSGKHRERRALSPSPSTLMGEDSLSFLLFSPLLCHSLSRREHRVV
jgi:hypothetical protein